MQKNEEINPQHCDKANNNIKFLQKL